METKRDTNARAVALTVLEQILEEGAYSNIAVNKALTQSALSPADKRLVTELVYGTVARKITLEWYLSHFVEDRDKLDGWVYVLLLMSLYQLYFLEKIPAHAVVYQAVNLAKRSPGTSSYVNAILRKILSQGLPDVTAIKRKNKRLSVQYSLPVWLVRALLEEYGEERAEKIFASLYTRSKASARVVRPERLEVLAEELGASRSLLSPLGLVKEKGNFSQTRAFQDGEITIQDETSQLVAPTLDIRGDELILDACAAPGGKTVHMASYLDQGRVIALDLYEHKLALIRENADRLGVSDKVETRQLDARQVSQHFPTEYFDKILVDAPCSGIGLIRRKPDIKYTKKSVDFSSLQEVQLQILESVCQTVKKGGIITYSTCTIMEKENQEVLRKFLELHPNFVQVPLTHSQVDIVKDGCILVTPELHQTDGFFIGQLKRLS
ncbi:16S rRNA (cytosine(967)-C(5))-methyltransferase RsmB [Streptococcus sp. DD13]|uniref:16S rRNA (cytosine(967)-C(5))-methyltransferase RsmB n=1 Tax=Streptococcus sp. DD13 TaxID=1777881 RepID=UPI00079BDDA3|nr:16S rRNA (cytosine(967)-C(5))-methyltransferase RsmB [Streptococcus sp. DD13]KXT77466.1 Ribosomal RNA small subunit methyltransferase B [Streptococcus sp. DD13]